MTDAQVSGRRRPWIVVLIVVVVAAAATVGVIALKGGSSAGAAVRLEPASATGSDPFTASVAIGPAVQFPGNVRAITASLRKKLPSDTKTHTLVAVGTAPGLYGGSGDTHVCDPQKLVSFLGQNPGKAGAWASVLGISPKSIGTYVATLTPVVLTSDTLVTNHGYNNGVATTLQSVLEAGTAVMVDSTGVPRVKCNCGNPLSPPEPITITKTEGTAWPDYAPTAVTTVRPGKKTATLTVINTETGDNYQQPVGATSGTGTGQWVAAEVADQAAQTTIVTSSNGKSWSTASVIPNAVIDGLAWGNGKWIAVTDKRFPDGTHVLESTDLKSWKQVAAVPDQLNGVAYGNGRWTAVGYAFNGSEAFGVMYSSTDAAQWTRVGTTGDLISVVGSNALSSVGYGAGHWVAVASTISPSPEMFTVPFTSTDGVHWTTSGLRTPIENGLGGAIAYGPGQWIVGAGTRSAAGPSSDGTISRSSDGRSWSAVPTGAFAHNPIVALAYGNGEWLAVGASQDQPRGFHGNASSTFFVSADGKRWSEAGHVDPPVSALAFGGTAAAGSTPPSTTPTVPTPTTIRSRTAPSITNIDFRNHNYEDRVCGTHQSVRVTNGVWRQDPTSNINVCGEAIGSVAFADVTGDGVADAIVTGAGSAGGTALGQIEFTTVFAATATGPRNLGYLDGTAHPPYSAAHGITLWLPHPGPNDPTCCPSSFQVTTYKYASTGKFTATGTTILPATQLPKG